MPKRLSDKELSSLYKWLVENDINENKIHRQFSDAVSVAQLLKRFYPKLIDLHNYPPRSNTQLKINNWETLNNKVLAKVGLQQNKRTIEKLAKGTPGAIEALLYDIMEQDRVNRQTNEKSMNDEQEQMWSENNDVMIVNVNKKIGDAIIQMPQKMILYSIYERTLCESQTKDSYLNAAHQKIAHLENIINLKTERIDELCAQLAKLSVRRLLKQHNLENSSPNSGLHMEQSSPPVQTQLVEAESRSNLMNG